MIMEEAVLGHVGEYLLRRASEADIEQVIQINEKTLPEHYSDYFYFEVLKDFPEGFIVAELYGRVVGYIMCRIRISVF